MTTAEKSGRRKKKVIDIFNFDKTFSLDSVEELLRATKAKVDFEIWIAKHYFPLGLMPELCKSIIPKMEMDVAVFVVNANESRLINNDEKSGSGYTKMYKALQQSTGDKVLVVIGEDDNYKSDAERDGNVLSSWAKRIMISQLNEQFLDGRKVFVFSWDKKHRQIHEEALLHYFDPKNFRLKKSTTVSDEETKGAEGNSGQNQLGDNDAGNDKSPGRSKEGDESCNRDTCHRSDVSQTNKAESFDSGTGKREELSSNKETRDSALGPGAEVQDTCHRSDVSQTNKAESFDSGTGKREELPSNKETPDSALGPGADVQDLVILGCNASDESVSAVYQVIQEIKPELNLTSDPPIVRQPPDELKSYLMRNKVKFCLLVVDAEAVKSALMNSQQRMEYKEVLKTASDKVVEKVIVAICGPTMLLESDEKTVTQAINSILKRCNKGFTVWVKGGQLQMDSVVLLEILQSVQRPNQSAGDVRGRQEYPVPSSNYSDGERIQRRLTRTQSTDNPGVCDTSSVPRLKQSRYDDQQSRGVHLRSYSTDARVTTVPASNQPYDQPSRAGHVMPHASQTTRNVPMPSPSNQPHNQLSRDGTIESLSVHGGEATATQSSNLAGAHPGCVDAMKGENVRLMIKAHLRYGNISKEDGDHWAPNWTVPDCIQDDLMSKYSDTSEAELLIFYDGSGALRSIVTPKIFLRRSFRFTTQKTSPHELLAPNESLILKTLILDGKVSLRPEDVECCYPGWPIPVDVIKRIEQNEWATSKANLSIISDELGNLRCVVQIDTLRKAQTYLNKLFKPNMSENTMKNS